MVRITTTAAHTSAVRLCALLFFFAFLGNVIDGPVMWMLSPPAGGFRAQALVLLNQLALIPALVCVVKPSWWPCLALCWHAWYVTFSHGGPWFFDGFDTMLLEVGFLCVALAITLTLFDGEEHVRSAEKLHEEMRLPLLVCSREDERQKDALQGFAKGSSDAHLQLQDMVPCSYAVRWTRALAEVSLTLVAFRLFFACGIYKLRGGAPCWRDLTCLYDFFEMQPCPTLMSWYLHTYTPHSAKRVMQFFSINIAELAAPCLLLCINRRRLLGHKNGPVSFMAASPVQACAAAVIMTFVLGIFMSGNFAFLHPLSVVPLVASMGTAGSIPMVDKRESGTPRRHAAVRYYRTVAPALVAGMLVFAFLPSLKAYAWMLHGSYSTGPLMDPLMESRIVKEAEGMYLGIPYNRHDYFANGLLHERNELIIFADLGNDQVELSIPYKVGRLDRMPQQTSPLHRRFAWQWLFLTLSGNSVVGSAAVPAWYTRFVEKLCEGDETAWAAVEHTAVNGRLPELKRIIVQLYRYEFAEPGSRQFWTRASYGNVSWPGLGTTQLVQVCK
mmetsp:Transcript_108872/g.318580  ORF Transcript_108872/g.318580 Transcript_108872/m.318580 type:complete len:556 (+) Transcript_108872:58-1725(+)